MSILSATVIDIHRKVESLISLHKGVKEENLKISAINKDLLKTVEDQKNIISDLEEKNKVIKLASSLTNGNESSLDVKLKINELVREIDKCIAYLNR